MHEDFTVREAMMPEFVGVSESDSLAGAAELMLDDEADVAVVLRGNEPVGMLSARDGLGAVLSGDDLESTTVGDAMRGLPPTVSPRASLAAAESTLLTEGARELLVVEDGELVGVLSERDLLTATASVRDEDTAEGATLRANGGEASRGESIATEAGEADYATQSICEVCGSLVSEPTVVDGQVLCADCREV